MKTTFKILGGVIVLAIVAVVGWHYYQLRRARQAGLLTENITHDGDLWKADFTARIPAPEQTVFDAIKNVENTHSDQVKAVRVVSQSGNKKTVDMDIAGPGGQVITTELAFEYLPDEKKIVYSTVNNPRARDAGRLPAHRRRRAAPLSTITRTLTCCSRCPCPTALSSRSFAASSSRSSKP